jgi:chemotaxis signal transduction protein
MITHSRAAQTLRFIRCGLGTETYCLHMSWVRSIQRVELMRPNTEAQGPVGWIANAGEEVPIFHLAALLEQLWATKQLTGKIVMLKTAAQPWGFLVDRVEGIIEVAAESIFPLPDMVRHPKTDWFDGLLQCDEALLLSLAPDGLRPTGTTYVAMPLAQLHNGTPGPSAPTVAIAPRARRQLLSFSITSGPIQDASLRFGLSISQIPQVLQAFALTPVPGARDGVLGLVQWRSGPLAVLDLLRCLGGGTTPVAPGHRLLIARATTVRAFVGIPILPHVKIHHLPLASRPSTRTLGLREPFVKGRFDIEHGTLVIPDIDRILHAYPRHLA